MATPNPIFAPGQLRQRRHFQLARPDSPVSTAGRGPIGVGRRRLVLRLLPPVLASITTCLFEATT